MTKYKIDRRSKFLSSIINATVVALVAAFMLIPIAVLAQPSEQTGNSFAVRDVRVFTGFEVIPHANVVVRDGIIRAVGPKADIPDDIKVYDGTGKTLLPGLIDAHVHTYGISRQGALRYGVTTELGMGGDWHILAAAQKQRRSIIRTNKADLWSAGMLATVPGGHGTEYPVPVETLTKPSQAQHWVDQRIKEGSDYIKIILEDGSLFGMNIPTLKPATVKALIDAAHNRGKMAVIHISELADARMAIKAGVDGLAHVFADTIAGSKFIHLIKQHGTFVIATLSVYSAAGCGTEAENLMADPHIKPYLSAQQARTLSRQFPDCDPEILKTAMENVRRLHAAGVPILAGTDAGNPGTAHGVSLHGELKLLVEAGLSPTEALSAATALPAKYFHLEDRGRIAPGLRADLLLVNGNPTKDITATRDIAAIWMNGYRVDRTPVVKANEVHHAPAAPEAPTNSLVSDFDHGKIASSYGSGWSITTDQRRGGQSTVDMKLTDSGANSSVGALHVSGEVKSGVMYPWAGVMFFPGKRPMAPVDFSSKQVLTFWTRGDGSTYTVMLFAGAKNFGMPHMKHFTAGEEWHKVTLPLSSFSGADLEYLRGIAFTAGPKIGKFHFSIDKVAIK